MSEGSSVSSEDAGPQVAPTSGDLRNAITIGVATGMASMSFDFWYPFMPLYLVSIGAKSDADALFWIAVATTVQGVARIATGPLWGVLSDRIGRKVMFLRALYLAVPTILIAAFINAPWQIAFALAFQGLFSGFVPAAVALISVTVPEERLAPSLSIVTGCQYIGTVMGPSVGAILAETLGYRGAILIASLLPGIAATGVVFLVAKDTVAERQPARKKRSRKEIAEFGPGEPAEPTLRPSRQLLFIILFYFLIFAMSQLIRLATPVAIQEIHPDHVGTISGLAFTLGGFGSAISVLILAPRLLRPGRYRVVLAAITFAAGVAYLLLAGAKEVPLFIACYVLITLLQAATIPATNTLVAASVPRDRRGTAFGWAASAQACAFIVGPAGAAFFGAVSLSFGFVVLGIILIIAAVLLLFFLVEPNWHEYDTPVAAAAE